MKITKKPKKENLKIRLGTEADLDRVSEIVKKIWGMGGDSLLEQRFGIIGNKPWQEWTSADILKYIREKMGFFLAAELKGKVVGFATYRLDQDRKIGTVGYNGVDPDYGGKGIGTKLVEKTLNRMRKNGIVYARVITGLNEGHKPARKMYEKIGFKPLLETISYAIKL
ncbi:MAG: GNAT family N-acetyltransferase [Candidatus Omnitrophota bacterium]